MRYRIRGEDRNQSESRQDFKLSGRRTDSDNLRPPGFTAGANRSADDPGEQRCLPMRPGEGLQIHPGRKAASLTMQMEALAGFHQAGEGAYGLLSHGSRLAEPLDRNDRGTKSRPKPRISPNTRRDSGFALGAFGRWEMEQYKNSPAASAASLAPNPAETVTLGRRDA
jgi:hypothetical protein